MDILKELETYKPKIDKEIQKILPKKISDSWVNFTLGKSSYSVDAKTLTEEVSVPIWDFLSRGGKRWRPVLMLWCCAACGGSEKKAMPFTTMPELVHNGCVTEDTIIWMADGTPKKIIDVCEGDMVLSIGKDGSIVHKPVVKKHDNGTKEVFSVMTNNRKIKVTANHPFLIARKKQPIRIKITKEGKRIITQKLSECGLTISEFCEKSYSTFSDIGCCLGHLKNALYSFEPCLIPKQVAEQIFEELNIEKDERYFKEIQCKYSKAEIVFEWKKAEELRTNDLLVVGKDIYETDSFPVLSSPKPHYNDRNKVPQSISLELCQLAGFLLGDGYVDEGRVVFCLPEKNEGRAEYLALIEKVFCAKPSCDKNSMTCCSKAIAKFLLDLGIKQKSHFVEIPAWVFKLPKQYKFAFIKGYIDADGHVSKQGDVRFACVSKKLMEQMKFLLDSLGFVTGNIYTKIVDNTHFKRPVSKNETTLFCFPLYSSTKVLNSIGSEIVTYRNRLMRLKQREVAMRYEELIPHFPEGWDDNKVGFSKITSVKEIGKLPTFDIEIQDTHNYISNGIITHNTIIADDIEDNADVRRGKPALHKLFGIDTAINDSTVIYYIPLVLIYRNLYKLTEKQRLQIYDLYCEEMLRVSTGQAIDIHWHKSPDFKTNEAQYLQMCIYKTGVLARFAAKLGAILANADSRKIEALGKFGESIGLAFQIQDDILNVNPKSENWGKEIGEDISEGKKTLLVIHTLKNANIKDRNMLIEILKKHTKDKKEIRKAIEIIKKYGAIEYSIKKANKIVEDSWKKVDGILPETAAKKKLRAFAEFCVNREI
ncbi:MAG: hypothetical protein COT15_01965 [Candidatus Diapherotrites archaeon CG08_land_8_20_14_0_20_34_12]|nr:MAG: hypothetical protein COT15_01965 [Candidatus Diapherotrites archaeon CG08_land_8_20_14_0_20_34_12]